MQIFVFANQKGGVGKTTLAVHLAIRAQQWNCRTLLVDLDQQGSSTYLFTGDSKYHLSAEHSSLDLWFPDREIQPLAGSNPLAGKFAFDCLPAHATLDRADDDLHQGVTALRRLRDLEYDVVVIDCPPAPNVRQLAPLIAADTHVIPVTPDNLGTQGIAQALQLYQQKIRGMNPRLELQILINRLKANSRTNRIIAEGLTRRLGNMILPYQLFEREDVRRALNEGHAYWEICKDAQRQEWESAFDSLLEGVPSVEDAPEGEEPEEADGSETVAEEETG